MKKIAFAFAAAATLAVVPAFAQDDASGGGGDGSSAASTTATATAAPAPAGGDEVKKIGVGADLQFIMPLGDLKDATGPQIGALVRVGYRVIPALEVTGRVGYLFGLSKDQGSNPLLGDVKSSVSMIPIWIGARYFIMDPSAGLYAGAEFGINMLSTKIDIGGNSASTSTTREGVNLSVGYVISKDMPIDIRVMYVLYNLLGKESGEGTFGGIGASVGYTASF